MRDTFGSVLASDILAAEAPPAIIEKVKLCLLDFLSCAFEARSLPSSQRAATVALRSRGDTSVIGQQSRAAMQDAAFANAVAGHGLVREDMHAGAVSHLGVVVLPALLALAQRTPVTGGEFATAAMVGYQVGAWVGRALVTPGFSRQWRPTGFTGPLAAAAAGARMLRLTQAQTASALALAANTVSGLNEWPGTGGDDMFFHPGTAARNALMAVELAEMGAEGTETALDGEAGLFAAAGARPPTQRLFAGDPEILAVFHKPLPLCNFAQTPAQAALRLVATYRPNASHIAAIRVEMSEAARRYPGCSGVGPFARVLQAKMSIPFCVAVALADGEVTEASFTGLDRPDLLRLAGLMQLEATAAFTGAFPAQQGAAITVTMQDGAVHRVSMTHLVEATPAIVRERFMATARDAVGSARTDALAQQIDQLEHLDNAGALMRLTEA